MRMQLDSKGLKRNQIKKAKCDVLKYKSNTDHANISKAKTILAKGKTQL